MLFIINKTRFSEGTCAIGVRPVSIFRSLQQIFSVLLRRQRGRNSGSKNLLSIGLLKSWREIEKKSLIGFRGNCMEPVLQDGDVLIVNHDLSDVKAGDIVVFKATQGLMAHRLIELNSVNEQLIFYTKADRSRQVIPMPEDYILGRVIGRCSHELLQRAINEQFKKGKQPIISFKPDSLIEIGNITSLEV